MSLLERLRRAKTAPKAVLHRVLLNEKPGDRIVHAFFEGKDEESFLSTFIERRVPDGWRLCRYGCGGKSGVLAAKGEIEGRSIAKERTWYFLDKDHDDFLGIDRGSEIYTTRYYSIENEVVCAAVLVRILRDLLSVDDHEIEAHVVEHFREQLAGFHRAMLVISAWVVAVRREGSRPDLSAVRMASLFEFDDGLVLESKRMPGRLGEELSRTGTRVSECSRTVLRATRELRIAPDPKRYVRGKWELWFFVQFALHLPDLLAKVTGAEGPRLRYRVTFGSKTAMQVLGPRTPEPPDLRDFLEARCAALVA